MTTQQLHERCQNIERLKQYEKQGKFPINTDYPNQKLPHIKDQYGTHCALAYLIHKSGQDDLVDTLFNENNNVYVNDVSEGPLINWLDKNGLTKAEAARIQPTYGNYEDPTTTALGLYVITLLWIFYLYLGYLFAKFIVYTKSMFDTGRNHYGDPYDIHNKDSIIIFFKWWSLGIYLYYFSNLITHFYLNRYFIVNDQKFVLLEFGFGRRQGYKIPEDYHILFAISAILVSIIIFFKSLSIRDKHSRNLNSEQYASIFIFTLLILLKISEIETYPYSLTALESGILFYLMVATLSVNLIFIMQHLISKILKRRFKNINYPDN